MAKQPVGFLGDCFSGKVRRFAMTGLLLKEMRLALWSTLQEQPFRCVLQSLAQKQGRVIELNP